MLDTNRADLFLFIEQSMTPKNDFCRLLAKQGLLDPLSTSLYNTIRDPQGGPYTEKIVQVMLIFSQGDLAVKELLATRTIVHRKTTRRYLSLCKTRQARQARQCCSQSHFVHILPL